MFKLSININKFIFLLTKDVYPSDCSNLSVEETTDADYMHEKRFCKDFERKKLGEYQDLHIKSDTLLLADFLKIFKKCV